MTWKEAAKLAIRYAHQGIPAGPVAISWDEAKGGTNKRPLTRHGHNEFSTDRETVARQFGAARHRLKAGEVMGVGLRPGPAGLVVVDVDVAGEKVGAATLAALEAEHGALPEHPVTTTASGGRHEWFRKAGHVTNRGLGENVDVRGDAGWAVAPGTVSPWGNWGEPEKAANLSSAPMWPDWMAARQGAGADRPESGPSGRWTELDRDALHPGELAALEALEALGGHSAYREGDSTIRVCRPGKAGGTSAQISWNGPDVVQVFSTDWKGLPAGTYDADGLAEIVQMHSMLDGEEGTGGTDEPPTGIEAQLRGLDPAVYRHARDIWARREAEKALRKIDIPEPDPPAMTGLAALLDEPDEDEQWRVQGLIPAGGNALLIAQAKSGKTTWINNLARCLADWSPFLTEDVDNVGDLGTVTPLLEGETLAIVDLELDRRTIRRWLRTQKIVNTDRVLVESLRGRTGVLDIRDAARRRAWAGHLASHNVKVLVVDCLGPLLAYYGADENSNTEVGQILAALEALKHEAGVQELILVHHAGHNGERSRGASRLRDWPDVEIRLMIEGSEDPRFEPAPDAPRYIAARGRDVALRERKLAFNPLNQRLSLAQEGGNRAQVKQTKQREGLMAVLRKKPGSSQRDLVGTNNSLRAVLQELIEEGLVHTWAGKGRSLNHALAADCSGEDCSRKEAHSSSERTSAVSA